MLRQSGNILVPSMGWAALSCRRQEPSHRPPVHGRQSPPGLVPGGALGSSQSSAPVVPAGDPEPLLTRGQTKTELPPPALVLAGKFHHCANILAISNNGKGNAEPSSPSGILQTRTQRAGRAAGLGWALGSGSPVATSPSPAAGPWRLRPERVICTRGPRGWKRFVL